MKKCFIFICISVFLSATCFTANAADTMNSALTALAAANIADGDLFAVVDVSDTTYGAGGTNKKYTWLSLKADMKTYMDTLYSTLALYDANTILYATTDNTPAALTVAEQRVVGRVTSGNISALTLGVAASNVLQAPADPAAHTLFGFDNTTNTYRTMLIGTGLSYDQATNTMSGTGSGYTNLTSFVDQTAWRVFYSNTAGDVTELALGSDGTYLRSNGATSAPTFDTPSGAAHDAVTLDTNITPTELLTLTGQAIALATQTANYGFFGPTTGSAAAPGFRAMVNADIPTTLTPQVARIGIGQAADGTNPIASSGFSVDPDGDTTVKSLTVSPIAPPGVTPLDSDSPGTDKTAGFLGWQYIDGADGAENSDWLLQIMQSGSLATVLAFDESDDRFETTKGIQVQGADITGGTNTFDITNGTATINVAAGAYLNVDSSLQTITGPIVISGNAGGSSQITIPNGTVNLAIGTTATLAGSEQLTNKTFSTGTVFPVTLMLSASDETTAITAATNKLTFRAPYAFTLTGARATARTAPTDANIVIDVNEAGVSVLATKITIEATENSSTTATNQPVVGDPTIADDALMSIDFDTVGSSVAGAGIKVTLYGTRTL